MKPKVTVLMSGEMVQAGHPRSLIQNRETAKAVAKALEKRGYRVSVLPAGQDLLERLQEARPDVVFNLCTGLANKSQQANVAAMLELSGIPFTGAGMKGHVLGLHKHLAKAIFMCEGINTPAFLVAGQASDLDAGLRFPAILKPTMEGSSVGVTSEGIVRDKNALRSQAERMLLLFQQPILIEEFIRGREVTVGILGRKSPRILPIVEITLPGAGADEDWIYSYEIKSKDLVKPICPAPLEKRLREEVECAAVAAWRAIGCLDFGRVDIRLDDEGRTWVLEVNTLPGMEPGYSELPRMAAAAGMSYEDLVETILLSALGGGS